jgi:dipicolinate synthase subunit A
MGKDARQRYLAEFLREEGETVVEAEEYLPGDYDVLLLPVPQTAQYLEKVIDNLKKGQTIYGCNFPLPLMKKGEERGVRFIDYMKAPRKTAQSAVARNASAKNAVATAEGAVAEALQHGCCCIQESSVLVTGFGCCGKVLAEKLLALRGRVTVAERKNDKREKAAAMGCDVVSFEHLNELAGNFDFVFNTVPALVLKKDFLEKTKRDVTIIDIASKPGGVDFDYCDEHKINASLCLGLPGKYAPKSSSKILLEVIKVSR